MIHLLENSKLKKTIQLSQVLTQTKMTMSEPNIENTTVIVVLSRTLSHAYCKIDMYTTYYILHTTYYILHSTFYILHTDKMRKIMILIRRREQYPMLC